MKRDKIGLWLIGFGFGGVGVAIGWGLYEFLISPYLPIKNKVFLISFLLIIIGLFVITGDADDRQ